MTIWKKYTELEPIKRLSEAERAALFSQHTIYLFEKRDGCNISVSLDDDKNPLISSHNEMVAELQLQNKMISTPEYPKAVKMLLDAKKYDDQNFIVYGELDLPVSPTRCEMKKKNCHWTMFDIYDVDEQRYLNNIELQALAQIYKIPMPRIILAFSTTKSEDAETYIQEALKWCARHKREGVVGKCYDTQIFFKEKRILKSPNKLRVPKPREYLPQMPEETIMRAFQHAYDEVITGGGVWSDKSKAMPTLAKHMQLEAREHSYEVPKDMYQGYLNTPEEKINGKNQG